MRYAIVSDIHSNLAAFEAVLEDVDRHGGVDEFWCLGDVVGYGPEPHECLALLQKQKHLCIPGNHDWGAIGRIELDNFNMNAAIACRWNSWQLTEEDITYLRGLPLTLVQGDITMAHGSPRDPIWEYLTYPTAALENLNYFKTDICLAGHTHVPLYFEYLPEREACVAQELPREGPLILGGRRLIINPGSVGQPRDGDPRASYIIYDADSVNMFHFRVPYDIQRTQTKMYEVGLPAPLAERLSYGW